MLSEYEATQVMFFISCHDQGNPVVKHLYELHKLRDTRLMYDICNTRTAFKIVDKLLEMNGVEHA